MIGNILNMSVDSIQIRDSDIGSSSIVIIYVIFFCAYCCVVYSVTENNIFDVGMINHINSKLNTQKTTDDILPR